MGFDIEKSVKIYENVRERLYDANLSRPEEGSNEEALAKVKAFLDCAATIAVGKWGKDNDEMPILAESLHKIVDAYLVICAEGSPREQ